MIFFKFIPVLSKYNEIDYIIKDKDLEEISNAIEHV